MQRFAVFSVILSVIVLVMVAEVAVDEYFPEVRKKSSNSSTQQQASSPNVDLPEDLDLSKTLKTSVLDLPKKEVVTEDEAIEDAKLERGGTAEDEEVELSLEEELAQELGMEEEENLDFESEGYSSLEPNAYLREEQVRSAGFVQASLEDEGHDDLLFKSVYVGDVDGVLMKKIAIKAQGEVLARAYVLRNEDLSLTQKLYDVVAARAADGLNVEINHTNQYGDASFYMNDTHRPSVAFLTVRIENLIYGFSYPKKYHLQITNLIKLIEWEK